MDLGLRGKIMYSKHKQVDLFLKEFEHILHSLNFGFLA